MPDGEHQFVNVTLAGARSPRAASRQGETFENLGDEVSRADLRRTLRAELHAQTLSGEIFHRIASSSTARQSTASLSTYCDRHTVPNER
jgi:hypothetical protein